MAEMEEPSKRCGKFCCKEEDQGTLELASGPDEGLGKGQSSCGVGLSDALQPHKENLAGAFVGTSSTTRECSSKDVWRSRSRPSRLSCQGPKWSCLLLRTALQDALSEVTKIYPSLKLRVSVDDITALLVGKNREVADVAKKVMKKLKEEIERKRLALSVTENGKEGNSKMIASCGFLGNDPSQFSEDGVTLWKRWALT